MLPKTYNNKNITQFCLIANVTGSTTTGLKGSKYVVRVESCYFQKNILRVEPIRIK